MRGYKNILMEMKKIILSFRQKYMKLGFHFLIIHALYTLLHPLLLGAFKSHFCVLNFQEMVQRLNLGPLITCSCLMVFLGIFYFLSRPRNVYLVDFSCYKPNPELMCPTERFMERSRLAKVFTEENLSFQKKVLERSGLGQKTYFPEAILISVPEKSCLEQARKEAEMVIFGCIDELLGKTGVKGKDIGIVVVNCSVFNSTPSLSAMVVNHYKLNSNVKSFNLSGMGCSAGLISIDLAKHLLQATPNTYALVVSVEVQSLNWYFGNDRSMLMTNCIFRLGGAAVLLSNRPSDRHRSKYQLDLTVRTNKGADENSYSCVFQREDDAGRTGVALSKDLMTVAGEALKMNITTLGPIVLPVSEQLMFFLTLVARKVFKKKIKPYIPNFKLAFEHFCIHAGGKAVLDAIEKNLELSEWHMEPSRMTLYRFGNTSSSSLWYELGYAEGKGRIRKGDRVWQIAFGSGFKCNSAVWRALKNVDAAKEKSPWMNEIRQFPVPSIYV
ncbi:unnamed protein product [Cuscuta europaea]|uniref:3-ketoacyl-CoA synthase n=1 Tax=Cuscuta europaea TaxID=41803 RepID=A0A9P0ZJL7_CUSEU|nr:unnamed protein product [Cuscuta europaea]